MSSQNTNLKVNDIFIISLSGLPYYSVCLGGNYCQKNPDHLLQSGFIAAMFQFASEFGQKAIKEVYFDEIYMYLTDRVISSQTLITVAVSDRVIKPDDVRPIVNKIADIFVENYGKDIKPFEIIDSKKYSSFTDELLNHNLISRQPMGVVPIGRKKSFWDKLRRL